MVALPLWKARTYLADESLEITTKQFDPTKITVAAFTPTTARKNKIVPVKKLTGLTPAIKVRPIFLGEYSDPVAGNWSDPIVLGTALTAGQGVRIVVDQTDPIWAKKIAGVQLAIAKAAGETYFVAGIEPLLPQYLRFAKVPDVQQVFYIDTYEEGWAELSDLKEAAPAKAYGCLPQSFNFGLGDDAFTFPHKVESFDSNTDSVTSKFKTGMTFGVKVKVNPADSGQLKNVLDRIGYNFYNENNGNSGAPLEVTPTTMIFDTDIPFMSGQERNRLVAWGVTAKSSNDAELSAAIKKKDAFDMEFMWYKSPYFHQSYQTHFGSLI